MQNVKKTTAKQSQTVDQKRIGNLAIQNLLTEAQSFFNYADGSEYLENTHQLTQYFNENAPLEDYDRSYINNVIFLANYQSVFIVRLQEFLRTIQNANVKF